jgi:hypothetical protein
VTASRLSSPDSQPTASDLSGSQAKIFFEAGPPSLNYFGSKKEFFNWRPVIRHSIDCHWKADRPKRMSALCEARLKRYGTLL